MSAKPKTAAKTVAQTDWKRVVEYVQTSRAMDAIEERELVPGKKIFYQFSARGHDMAQVLLGLHLTHPKDAMCGYYRSRPILLSLGVALEDALGSAMGRAGRWKPTGPSGLPSTNWRTKGSREALASAVVPSKISLPR